MNKGSATRSSFKFGLVFAIPALVFVYAFALLSNENTGHLSAVWVFGLLSAIVCGLLGFAFGLVVGIGRKEPYIAFYLMAAVGLLAFMLVPRIH